MRYSLRSLVRTWKDKTAQLFAGDPGRKRRGQVRPNVIRLEDKTVPSGTATGLVFQDYNANGRFDAAPTINNAGTGSVGVAADRGLGGITVTAYDAANQVRGTTTTAANGSYSLALGASGPYRVEFTNFPAGYFAGNHGVDSFTAVQFVPEGGAAGVDLGLVLPEHYSQNNPTLITSCYVFGDQINGPNANSPVIVSFGYDAGTQYSDPTQANFTNPTTHSLAVPASAVGTTWGLAYDKVGESVYAAAFMKKHSGFGPGGTGAIYRMGTTGSSASLYVDLNAVFGAGTAGADAHAGNGGNYDTDNGNTAWDAVGKTSLGGMDVSADGQFLFVVNLADRRLYVIPTSGPLNSTTIRRFDLPQPGSVAVASDLRPFAVTYYQGSVYVGAVNSAESTTNGGTVTGDRTALRAYVFRFDTGSNSFSSTPVLDVPLNYNRGLASGINTGQTSDDASANWLPWSPVFKSVVSGSAVVYPQPMLTGLAFDTSGNMVLGLRDRLGDQTGLLLRSNPGSIVQYFGIASGDILRATRVSATQWSLENNGSATGTTTAGAGNNQGPGGGEFYFQDNKAGFHDESSYGGVYQGFGFPDVVTTSASAAPTSTTFSGGVRWFSNVNGAGVKAYQLYSSGPVAGASFGKANGVGDLIAVTGKPPIEVGNRVWNDSNGNGVQDPNEPGIAGVVVQLFDGNGAPLGSATTDAAGNYYFSSASGANTGSAIFGVGFVAGQTYELRIATGQGPLVGLNPTVAGAGVGANGFQSDSNGVLGGGGTFTTASFVAGAPGQNDHTLDFGFTNGGTGVIGDLVFFDSDCDGIQDPAEFGLPNVTVNLLDGSGNFIDSTMTDANGLYRFTNLNPGNYVIEFVPLPGFIFSPRFVGADPKLDSDANITTGRSAVVTLTAGQENNDIDAGLCKNLLGIIGDLVYFDADCDGIQDPGEFGLPNNRVNLLDTNGNVIATTLTDANGLYQFANLPAGNYVVEFIPLPGFFLAPQGVGGDPKLDSDPNPATGRTNTIVLAAGEVNLDIDAGICKETTASLGNFVWLDLNCDGIQQPNEAGVPNVTVNLFDGAGNFISTTTTDANGIYGFNNLNPGDYSVRFVLPAGFTFSPQMVSGDPTVDSNPNPATGIAPTVTLLAGEVNLTVDAGLCPVQQKSKLGDYVWLDTDCDGIQDPNEPGVQGVTVNLLNAAGTVVGTTTTDATGKYFFDNLDPGTYSVRFTLPNGYAFTKANQGGDDSKDSDVAMSTGPVPDFVISCQVFAPPPPSVTSGATPQVTLAAGESNLTLDAGLVTLRSISGYVYVDRNDNGVFDPGETPIPGVLMTVTGTDDLGRAVNISGLTDANGLYSAINLRPGVYTIRETQPAGYIDGKDTLGTPFPGTVGNDVQTVTIPCDGQMTPGINYNFGELLPSSLCGTVYLDLNDNGVQDPGERGIAGVQIILTGTSTRGAVNRTIYTAADGTYCFTGLFPGTYQVNEIHPTLYVDGKDRVGSEGGVPGNDVTSQIPIGFNVNAVHYDFGEKLKGFGGKEDLLASSKSTSPTLAQDVANAPSAPTFANAVATTQVSDPNVVRFVVTGSDAGTAPIVKVYDFGSGQLKYTITAYDANFRGGVRVATGDVTGDGVPDIITAPGVGGGPHVKVFDGATGTLVAQFFAYAASFAGGVYVSVGDIDGNGVSEIVTGAGDTGGSHVKVFTAGGTVVREFFAYNVPVGARVATGDVDGDGKDDIVTAPGPNAGSHVKVYSGANNAVVQEFFAYPGFTGGVYVAAGDVNGDGRADVITGAGAGGGSHVKVFNGAVPGAELASFFAYGSSFTGGVRVGAADVNGDGRAEVLTAPGSGLQVFVSIFDVNRQGNLDSWIAYDQSFTGGGFINGGPRRVNKFGIVC